MIVHLERDDYSLPNHLNNLRRFDKPFDALNNLMILITVTAKAYGDEQSTLSATAHMAGAARSDAGSTDGWCTSMDWCGWARADRCGFVA